MMRSLNQVIMHQVVMKLLASLTSQTLSSPKFARNLRQLRQQRGLSQEVLAELTGLHHTYVGSVERGERNVSIDNMERFAQALGVDLRELLAKDDDR